MNGLKVYGEVEEDLEIGHVGSSWGRILVSVPITKGEKPAAKQTYM
jgi:hypothetical protein